VEVMAQGPSDQVAEAAMAQAKVAATEVAVREGATAEGDPEAEGGVMAVAREVVTEEASMSLPHPQGGRHSHRSSRLR
jgi:hypothetical protein